MLYTLEVQLGLWVYVFLRLEGEGIERRPASATAESLPTRRNLGGKLQWGGCVFWFLGSGHPELLLTAVPKCTQYDQSRVIHDEAVG